MDNNNENIATALKGNTRWETVKIAGKTFTLQCVKDPDILLEAISAVAFEVDERLPYWADIWPSAYALSEYILENQAFFRGKNILEIGCGLGLVGIVATAIGGKVLFTDHDDNALNFTRINFKRNFKRSATVEKMDWRDPGEDQKYDIILAADVLYEKRWIKPVVTVIEKKLETGGTAFIAEPNRSVARDFLTILIQKNWDREFILKQVNIDDKLYSVSIHRIKIC